VLDSLPVLKSTTKRSTELRIAKRKATGRAPPNPHIRCGELVVTAPAQTDRMKAFTMIHVRRQHVGKWFGQASDIEELRAENQRLKEQVATLEARLRTAYADAGVTALAGSASPTFEAAAPTPVPAPSSPASASLPELNAVELQMIAEGRMIYAVKNYKDRTGLDLKTSKAAIDAARSASAHR